MNDEAFARLVAEEVKNRVAAEQRDYLLLPENWTRWQRALLALIDNLDRQEVDLDDREKREAERYRTLGDDGLKFLAEAMAENENRRKKIVRFRFHVETRLDEVTRMIALGSSEVDDRLKVVEFLRLAIERHKEMMQTRNYEPTPIDEALWLALDGKWAFDEIGPDATD